MPSADLFLQLLEEKELVSPEVLQAARLEMQRSPLPPDAVRLSLWLVQGQHITASQAERLLAATAEKTEIPAPQLPTQGRFQAKPAQQPQTVDPAGKPDVHTARPRLPEPPRPSAAPGDDIDLAPLDVDAEDKPVRAKPASVPREPASSGPLAGSPVESQSKKGPIAPKIGGELESLETTMQGPLDALSASEALEASPFDDQAAGLQLDPAAPKKFTFRRFFKNLFQRNSSKVVRVKAADPRHVKLVLISWGVAIVGLMGLLTAFWAFSPPGSTELLQKADEAMTADDFGRAIGVYDKFLKHYANAPNADDVRMLRGIAELRQAEKKAQVANDWAAAVEIAQTQVNALPKAHVDSDRMQEFSIALANIGEGLAQQVQVHPDVASVDRLQSVVNMLESHIPAANQPTTMLNEIKGFLQHGKQEVEGRRSLDRAVDEIREDAKAEDIKAAYAAYRDFVRSCPELTDNAQLAEAMKLVSAVQQKGVQLVQSSRAAVHEERPSGVLAGTPLAVQPVKGKLAAVEQKLVFTIEQGTAYGLDAATGKVLWRRFVAQDPKFPAVTALPLADKTDLDAVLCDPEHQELLRIHGTTGALVWRLVVGQPIAAEPVQVGKWLLLLTKDQRMLMIDTATGNSPQFVQLPQAVRLRPVVDLLHGLLFLTADESNVIVLDSALDGPCRQVLHVGHERGKIAATAVVAGDFLLLPINDSPGQATIRVFSIAKGKEGGPLRFQQTIRVAGTIDISPVAVGQGAAVITAQGSMFALGRNEPGNALPFRVVASKLMSLRERTTHFAIGGASTFWVADRQLTRYAVSADEQRIVPQATSDLGMKFVQAPVLDGGTMFQVLQKTDMPGVNVSAFDVQRGEAVWRTWLAAPLVAEPTFSSVSGKLTAVTASGGMFRSPLAGLEPHGKPWEPILTIDSTRLAKPLSTLLTLPGDVFALTSGRDTKAIAIYDPKEQDKQFRWLLSPREMAAGPGDYAGGLLTPCTNGQVFLLDPEAQPDIAQPLKPPVADVSHWEWRTPVSAADGLAVLSDGDKRLMAIRIGGEVEKALTEAAAVISKNSLVSPVAVLGKTVFIVAVDAANATQSLQSFELPNLAPGKSQALGARCVWGPQRVGKLVLVATEKNRLIAVSEQQQVVWQSVLGYGPLAGVPLLSGEEIFLSARSGMVWRISAADGKELGKVNADCPLGTGPLVVGSRVIIGGHDGSLLEVKKP